MGESIGNQFKDQLRRIIRDSKEDSVFGTLRPDRRRQCRYTRVSPVVLVPFEGGNLETDSSIYGLSRDLSDSGMSILSPMSIDHINCVVGMINPTDDEESCSRSNCLFLRGSIRASQAIGGSYWQLGIRLDGFFDDESFDDTRMQLACQLIPQKQARELSAS